MQLAAVYNKPVSDAEKHWIRITDEEANSAIVAHSKAIPYDFIDVMYKLLAKCEA